MKSYKLSKREKAERSVVKIDYRSHFFWIDTPDGYRLGYLWRGITKDDLVQEIEFYSKHGKIITPKI